MITRTELQDLLLETGWTQELALLWTLKLDRDSLKIGLDENGFYMDYVRADGEESPICDGLYTDIGFDETRSRISGLRFA